MKKAFTYTPNFVIHGLNREEKELEGEREREKGRRNVKMINRVKKGRERGQSAKEKPLVEFLKESA